MFESSLEKVKIGTRSSKLALLQASELKESLLKKTNLSENQIEIVPVITSGDKILDRNLADIGGKGLFIKELEEALLSKKIDVAVHSAKDMPPIIAKNTIIAAFTKRYDSRDYFISKKFNSIKDLPLGAVVGTSSARRKAALLRIRPDLKIVNFRGNVDSRISKLEMGEVDATILAVCGLMRMKKEINNNNIISHDLMLSPAGQGSLAIQVRQDDLKMLNLINTINHQETAICVATERKFLLEIQASCKSAVSVYCEKQGEMLNLSTIIFDFDGSEIFATKTSGIDGDEVAKDAATKTKKSAASLLEKIIDL